MSLGKSANGLSYFADFAQIPIAYTIPGSGQVHSLRIYYPWSFCSTLPSDLIILGNQALQFSSSSWF
ncbi:hypothetical protein CS542_00095 [Pedobacter sp. IW39]|nr:hypothetical protein CS542_00095 [Pedobacter sp. IW39]